jgi:ABC-2 type transport system permease protein
MHFLFQLSVLIGALLIFRRPMAWSYLPLLLAALIVLLVFVSALAVAFSAMNVYLRDIQHLLELVLLAWFWFSPIVYPYQQVAARLGQHANVLLLNPMIPIIVTFQKVIYNPAPSDHILPPNADAWWYARNLGIIGVASIVLFFVAMRIFARLEDNLAEEI